MNFIRFENIVNNDDCSLNLSKLIDEIIDDRIINKNNNVYVWKSSRNDIEGVMSELCGTNFTKSEWKKYIVINIEEYINVYDENHPDNPFLKDMMNFFK